MYYRLKCMVLFSRRERPLLQLHPRPDQNTVEATTKIMKHHFADSTCTITRRSGVTTREKKCDRESREPSDGSSGFITRKRRYLPLADVRVLVLSPTTPTNCDFGLALGPWGVSPGRRASLLPAGSIMPPSSTNGKRLDYYIGYVRL